MIIHCNVPVSGVPFITTTRAIKTVQLISRSDTELIIEMDVKTLDAPYCDTFTCKIAWIVQSAKANEQRSVIKVLNKIDFTK